MSIVKEAINKIKAVLKFNEASVPTSAKLKDGTEVTYTTLAAGGSLMIAGAPAPEGTYELEDGTSVGVDATGIITTVNGVGAEPVIEQTQAAPSIIAPVVQSQQKYEVTEELTKPEGIRALMEKFATGTPEERIENLELIGKVLMEYTFGWQIREQQEKVNRDAAIKVYTDKLQNAQAEIAAQREVMASMLPVLEQLAESPTTDPPPTKTQNFAVTPELKKKTLGKFQAALAQLDEQKATRHKAAQPA